MVSEKSGVVMKQHEQITECIACGGMKLISVLNLRDQPLANSYKKTRDEEELYFPLAINRCDNCYHIQLTHKVNPDLLFKNYLYVSGTTKTQLDYFEEFTKMVLEQQPQAKRVLDIGCNDGSQLDVFKKYGLETVGVDPAENLYEISSKKHNVICDYFDSKLFIDEKFDVVVCQNAFAHNYDQLKFLLSVKGLLNDGGKLYITTSQANMIVNNEFDTIYHEHLSFYNTKSMQSLCKRAGLHLTDVKFHKIHGTSYIFIISLNKGDETQVLGVIDEEEELGLYKEETYVTYANKCNTVVKQFTDEINKLKNRGTAVIGYGAPAKGNTLMNYALTTPDFIIDDNPLKQGLYTPGVSVKIYGAEFLETYKNVDQVCFVPLAWNFFDEIRKRIKIHRPDKNDLYLRYFPEVRIEQ